MVPFKLDISIKVNGAPGMKLRFKAVKVLLYYIWSLPINEIRQEVEL